MLSRIWPKKGEPSPLGERKGVEWLFSCSLSLVSVALGLNIGFYPVFCLCAGIAVFLLYQDVRGRTPGSVTWCDAPRLWLWACFYLPLCLFAYTALTPGHFLKDLPIASKMLAAWIIGFAAARLPKSLLTASLWALPVVLAVSIAASPLFGYSGAERLRLGFSHPNVFGLVAGWSVLLVMVLRDACAPRGRFLAFGAAAICIWGVVLASSRAALLGLAAGSIFLPNGAFRKALPCVLGACLVAGASACLLPSWNAARLQTALCSPFSDATFQSRLPIWEAAWQGFLHSPVQGNGVRTFEAWHKSYVANHQESLRNRYRTVESTIKNPHHFFLGLLYMYGLAGTILFMATLIPVALRIWREKNEIFPITLVFFITQGMFEFVLHRKDGIFILFFSFGLACARVLSVVVSAPGNAHATRRGPAGTAPCRCTSGR